MDLLVSPNGAITAIYAEDIDLRSLGTPTITRASHVEPDAIGQWFAEIVDGPTLGPFLKRSDALAAEIDWLTRDRLNLADDQGRLPGSAVTNL